MKARDLTVGVTDFGGEIQVIAVFKIKGSLKRESPNLKELPGWSRVSESARKKKAKEIAAKLETLDFGEEDLAGMFGSVKQGVCQACGNEPCSRNHNE